MTRTSRRVAVVTGGSRGIGAAVCRRLANDGYEVFINYRSRADCAQEVRGQIASTGGVAHAIEADVTDTTSVRSMFAEVKERAGRLDLLVNSAGILHESLLSFTTVAKFLEVLQVNLIGSFSCMQAAVRLMLPQRSGCIVNVSSAAALRAPVGLGAYAASKAALNAMASTFAREVASKGIRINTVAPAWVETEMLAGSTETKTPGARRVAIDRIATVEDVADAVAAIAGDDFRYVIGQVIVLDGGGLG